MRPPDRRQEPIPQTAFAPPRGGSPAALIDSFAHSPSWRVPRSAYLHVPFCQHHCGYCDFAVVTGRAAQIDDYLDALACELAQLGEPRAVETWFIGGGTPTYLSSDQLRRLLALARQWFPLAPGGEASIESTPESLSSAKLDALADGGITRVSIGVQSFHAPSLQTLDRLHSAEAAGPAVDLVRSRGLSVSLDLIFGVPGQREADWQRDLACAIALRPDHLSSYGLTFEKGTPLWKRRRQGVIATVEEETERAMYLHAVDALPAAGFPQYEVSNFAPPGQHCRHNETYWANHAYFGVGLGAARYVEGCREVNTRSFDDYLKRSFAGEPATVQSEQLDGEERARETLMLGLRRTAGIDRRLFARQTGYDLDELVGDALPPLLAGGFVRDNGCWLALTREGLCVADAVIGRLMAA